MADQPELFSTATETLVPAPSASRIVPFGKYQRQPFEALLADSDYAIWLMNSMKAKLERQYPALLAFLVGRFGIPDCTPEHNKLQNRFLDRTFALRFALATSQRVREITVVLARFDLLKSWTNHVQSVLQDVKESTSRMPRSEGIRRIAEVRSRLETEAQKLRFATGTGTQEGEIWKEPVEVSRLEFEQAGADVSYRVTCSCSVCSQSGPKRRDGSVPDDGKLFGYYEVDGFNIEVKPLVGDDYPAVLRAMKAVKNKQLLVGEYCGEGATWDEVVKIFSLSGIVVVLLEDVERTPLPETFNEILTRPLAAEDAVAALERAYNDIMG